MEGEVIHWGIIGAGSIAKKFASDLSTIPNAKLYAIASRTLDKAKDFGKTFQADVAYGDYKELILDPIVDAVYIATPHSFHKEHTMLCLNHHIPVLCEKPFAMNLKEVEEMIQLARKKETLLMEAMWTIFLPHFRYALDLIDRQHFGALIKLEADFGFQPEYNETSRLFDKQLGGGSLLDIGIYPIFSALSSLGSPEHIEARAEFFPTGADSECDIQFHYKNALAKLNSTFKKETDTEAIFHCNKGIIKINGRFHEPSSISLIDHNGNEELKTFHNDTIGNSYEIEHFNQLIRQGKTESDIMTFDKSRQLISTLDKVGQCIGLEYN
jgi:predicted dehydrogenase